MLKQDQREVRAQSQAYKCSPKSPETLESGKRLTRRCIERAQRMLEILDDIGVLTLDNIGADGSEAVTVLALHAKYSIMKRVLSAYEIALANDRTNVYLQGIPSLTDRVLIAERKKQRFATQWWFEADGTHYLHPVEDFKHLNERRAMYGLDKARRPRDLTYGIPKGPLPPCTRESDQQEQTLEEYENTIRALLD